MYSYRAKFHFDVIDVIFEIIRYLKFLVFNFNFKKEFNVLSSCYKG